METPSRLIKWAERELERSNVKCARHDAERLFMDAFQRKREDVVFEEEFRPPIRHLNLFRHHISLRASRYPLQYILNKIEFYGLSFALEEGIFIPRPETEVLVEKVAEHLRSRNRKRVNILEIGTGCGNIAISLTKNLTGCKMIASDISDKALKTAEKNARANGVKKNIKFIKSDAFSNISSIFYNYFDVIISNPPYIRRNDLMALESELSHEDIRALDGGKSGLRFYRKILRDGLKFLKKGGIFGFEVGYDQADEVASLMRKDSRLSQPTFHKDHSGYKRVVMVERRPQAQHRKRIG